MQGQRVQALLPEPQGTKRCQGMGAGASLQEDVPTGGWHALAAMAEAADKPDLVVRIVREHQIDAVTALDLDDDDLRELVTKNLDFKKLRAAREQLRARHGPAKVPPPTAAAAHLVSSDSEDDASDGDEIPPHVPRISNDEIDRAEALDARGGVFAATWRPRKGQPVAVALKAVDVVDLAEVFALRSFADPNVLVLYGVVVAGRSDVATVAERPDAALDVVLCGNPLPRVDSLRVARDMASALTFLHSREVAHLRLAPSNVLCHRAPHLRCKVADFGASVSAAIERLERSPRARAYAAPELLEAVRAPSAAARRDLYACDAWAYGCVIVEVLSGTAPWDGVDGEGILAQVVDAARAPDLPEKASAEELLTLARECFARLATPRPAMGDVVARVEALLEADYARGASAEQRLAKVEEAIEAEEASDRAAYKEAWRCCTTASGDAIDGLLKLSESLAATYAATPRHAALARDAPVAELLDLAAEVGESVHATLKRVVTAAGGTYEEGPLKTKARIQQKRRSADYGGDLARVVDVVRGQGIFHDNQAGAFEAALQGLVADAASGEEAKGEEDGDRLVLVRVKDRLNTPVEKSGHRDVLINFEHELTAVRKFETIWPLSHWLISAQAHGLRRRAPTDVQRPSGRQGVGAPDLQHLTCSRGRRGGGGRERAQSPQLGRPLAGRARVESDRPLALRRIDRAAKGARGRAAPGTSRVRHLRRDRRRGESAPRPRRRRSAPATA